LLTEEVIPKLPAGTGSHRPTNGPADLLEDQFDSPASVPEEDVAPAALSRGDRGKRLHDEAASALDRLGQADSDGKRLAIEASLLADEETEPGPDSDEDEDVELRSQPTTTGRPTTTVKDVLDRARGELGYRESRGNRTKYGKWYGLQGP
jgi:hypothetical protein